MNSLSSIKSIHKINTKKKYNISFFNKYYKWSITDLKNFSTNNSVQVTEFIFVDNNNNNINMTNCTVTNPNGSSPNNESVDNLKDNNLETKFLDSNIKNNNVSNVLFTFPQPIIVSGYKWVTGNDTPERDPKSWQLYGSHDGINWIIIDTITNYMATDNRKTYTEIFKISKMNNIVVFLPFESNNILNNYGSYSLALSNIGGSITNINNRNALYLNGTSASYLNLGTIANIPTSGMSFTCWIYPLSTNGDWHRIFDFGNGPGSDNILIGFQNNQQNLAWHISGYGTATQETNIISNKTIINKWTHVIWTLSNPNANNRCTSKLYIDKQLERTSSNMIYPRNIPRQYNYIGKSNWNSDPYYKGYIDDFMMFDKELTQTEINELY